MFGPQCGQLQSMFDLAFGRGQLSLRDEIRVDATQWASVPNSVSWTWGGQEPLPLEAGGFGTWTGSLVAGNGNWNYELVVDELDGVERALDLTSPVTWDGGTSIPVLVSRPHTVPGAQIPTILFTPFLQETTRPVGRPRHPVAQEEAENRSDRVF